MTPCFLNPLPSLDTVLRSSLRGGEGGKRDSVCECGRGSRREISESFRRMILADWPICSAGASKIHADGASSDTNCCDRKGARAGSSMARCPLPPPCHVTTLHLVPPAICFFFPLAFSVFTPTSSAAVAFGCRRRRVPMTHAICFGL